MKDVFFFFSFFVNRDSDETLTARKRKREREKTEKQGAAEETNKRWTLSLSFGISCQDWWHSQPPLLPPFKLRSENGAKRKGGQNMAPSLPNTLGADSTCFCMEGGQRWGCVCVWMGGLRLGIQQSNLYGLKMQLQHFQQCSQIIVVQIRYATAIVEELIERRRLNFTLL